MAQNLGKTGRKFNDEARRMGDIDVLDNEMLDGNEDGTYTPVEPKLLPNYDGSRADVKKATDMRKYSWMATINNPEKIYPGKTPEEIVDLIGAKFAGKTRCCMVNYERGLKEGTDHCHVLVESNNRSIIRASTLDKLFPAKGEDGKALTKEIDVYDGDKKDENGKRATKKVEKPLYWLFWHEPTTSSFESVLAYFSKVGSAKNKAKNETLIVPPKEFGEGKLIGHIGSGRGKKQDFDLNAVMEYYKRGLKPRDIYAMDQNWRYHASEVENMYTDYMEDTQDTRWTMNVHWLIGAPGTRKTSYVEEAERLHGRSEVYKIDNYQHPFDNYSGQKCIYCDDFRGASSHVPFSVFLVWSVGFRGRVDARYADKVKAWSEMYISSVLMPEEVYPNQVSDKDNIEQLKRRITSYIYFFRTKDGEYHHMEFPATLTTSQEELQTKVLEVYPDAVFKTFLEPTWDDYLANNGLEEAEKQLERVRETKRRMKAESFGLFTEDLASLTDSSQKTGEPLDVEPVSASTEPQVDSQSVPQIVSQTVSQTVTPPASSPAPSPGSQSVQPAETQYLYTPDMEDSLEQSLAELADLFEDDEDDDDVQELLDAMKAANASAPDNSATENPISEDPASPVHGDDHGDDHDDDDDDPDDGPSGPGGFPAPSDDEYVSDFFAAGGFDDDWGYDPDDDPYDDSYANTYDDSFSDQFDTRYSPSSDDAGIGDPHPDPQPVSPIAPTPDADSVTTTAPQDAPISASMSDTHNIKPDAPQSAEQSEAAPAPNPDADSASQGTPQSIPQSIPQSATADTPQSIPSIHHAAEPSSTGSPAATPAAKSPSGSSTSDQVSPTSDKAPAAPAATVGAPAEQQPPTTAPATPPTSPQPPTPLSPPESTDDGSPAAEDAQPTTTQDAPEPPTTKSEKHKTLADRFLDLQALFYGDSADTDDPSRKGDL